MMRYLISPMWREQAHFCEIANDIGQKTRLWKNVKWQTNED